MNPGSDIILRDQVSIMEAIANSGDITGAEPNKYLHGKAKRDFQVDHIYQVEYPRDGKFIIHIDIVSLFIQKPHFDKKHY